MKLKTTTDSVSWAVLDKPDLLVRENRMLRDIQGRIGFIPKKRLGGSRYWGSNWAGAVFYQGIYQKKKAVLKIQGVKPPISEVRQIKGFEKQNQSHIIRPPRLYGYLKWDDKKLYEALILEYTEGKPIINCPTNKEELREFFKLYQEYRLRCRNQPWLSKPKQQLAQIIDNDFAKWRQISQQLYPTHPFRRAEDRELIDAGLSRLKKEYAMTEGEFVHGHFSDNELVKLSSDDVVLLANLYWKYKAPFSDAVFGYHWFIYRLAQVANISPALIEEQREWWLEQIYALAKSETDRKQIDLALLERAMAGLTLDALSVEMKLPMAAYLVETTRTEVGRLLAKTTRTVI